LEFSYYRHYIVHLTFCPPHFDGVRCNVWHRSTFLRQCRGSPHSCQENDSTLT
jgi:hypothetical protein